MFVTVGLDLETGLVASVVEQFKEHKIQKVLQDMSTLRPALLIPGAFSRRTGQKGIFAHLW